MLLDIGILNLMEFLQDYQTIKEEFGIEVDNLWLPDVFGYSAALPQILKKADINYFLTQKISWNQFNEFPYQTRDVCAFKVNLVECGFT